MLNSSLMLFSWFHAGGSWFLYRGGRMERSHPGLLPSPGNEECRLIWLMWCSRHTQVDPQLTSPSQIMARFESGLHASMSLEPQLDTLHSLHTPKTDKSKALNYLNETISMLIHFKAFSVPSVSIPPSVT